MPTTFVQAPPVQWPYRVSYPGPYRGRRTNENFVAVTDASRVASIGAAPQSTAVTIDGNGGGETGATTSDQYRVRDGVSCTFVGGSPRGFGWSFPWWVPIFDGSAIPAGVRIPEGSVVSVIDAMFRVEWASGGDADMVGTWIGGALGGGSTANYRNNTPGGANPGADTGGAGFLIKSLGGGYDFVTWGLGGAVANRISVPCTQTQWQSFRFVLVSGTGGQNATLQAYHNGDLVVEDTYGSATLPLPYDANGVLGRPSAAALAFTGVSVNPPTNWMYRFDGKFGRFLPSGAAAQQE